MIRGKTQYNLALLALRQGYFEKALAYLAQARTDLAAIQNPPDLAYADLYEARIRRALRQPAQAEWLLQRALQVFKQPGYHPEYAETLIELAHLCGEDGQSTALAQGLDYLDQALAVMQRFPVPIVQAQIEMEQGEFLLRLARPFEAAQHFENAQRIFCENALALRQAWAETLLADCYWKVQPVRSRQLYQSALEKAGDALPLLAAQCWYGFAHLSAATSDWQAAERSYITALHFLKLMRQALSGHIHQASFASRTAVVLEELLQVIANQPAANYRMLHWVEQSKAQVLAELLTHQPPDTNADPRLQALLQKRQDLRDELDRRGSALRWANNPAMSGQMPSRSAVRFHDAHQSQALSALHEQLQAVDEQITREADSAIAWREAVVIEAEKIHHLIDHQTVLISYFGIQGHLYALTATQTYGDVRVHDLGVELGEIEQLWEHTYRWLIRLAPVERLRPRLAALWEKLIRPLESCLAGKTCLMISPYQSLFMLPFAAFYDPIRQQYLLENWCVQYIPSATVLSFCQAGNAAIRRPPLVVGYAGKPEQPDYLPGVGQELEMLRDIFPDADVLSGQDASTTNVLEAMTERSILHLAGHAYFDAQDPLVSGMPLADDRWLRASDLYLLHGKLKGAVVVLSGCEMGLGKADGGEVLGLTSAFLYAGASSVIAGLWRVNDAATAVIMQSLYRRYVVSNHIAQALQMAQLDLVHQAEFSHPYFWAAFGLNGYS